MLRLDKEQYFKIWLESTRADGTKISEHDLKLNQSAFNYAWSLYQKKNKLIINENKYFLEAKTRQQVILSAIATDQHGVENVLYTYLDTGVLHIMPTHIFNASFVHIDDERNRVICCNCGYYLSGCHCGANHNDDCNNF